MKRGPKSSASKPSEASAATPASAPVKVSYSFLKILTGSDMSRRRLPVMSAVSARPGPVVWLTACGHGDEVCGIVIVQELFRGLRRRLLRGAIHAFPLMNPMGFETGSRGVGLSKEDLNRSFPGDPDGSLGKRLAALIFSRIMDTGPDLVLDLHNDWRQSVPYALIDRPDSRFDATAYGRARDFLRRTGFIAIADDEALPHSLSHNLLRHGVPALTLELGESYVVNEANVRYGLKAIGNILAGLEMTPPPEAPFRYPAPDGARDDAPLAYSDKPYSSKSGIVRFLAKSGDRIATGQPFAHIYNAFGKRQETLRARADAIVLGHCDWSVVFPGMPIMAFGVKDDVNAQAARREAG